MFIRTAGGLYVAWSLNVPSSWGEWVFVEVVRSKRLYQSSALSIVPRRALSGEEIHALRQRPLLFWGMKVHNAPWALVLCKTVSSIQLPSFAGEGFRDPARAIGV
ncbi:hypothetical protein K2P47_04930 [Patescibacteria group bacterium]|nr:hypothetical protein [Patescibacteria group bacterium]